MITTVDYESYISLDVAKEHLRVSGDDEDNLILIYLKAAQDYLEGPTGILNQCLSLRTLALSLDEFPDDGDDILLEFGPVSSVLSITYRDADSADQVLEDYTLLGDTLSPIEDEWPADCTNVRITYEVGSDEIDGKLVVATLLLLTHFYENRSATTDRNIKSLPIGIQSVLMTLWRVAI